MAAVAVYHVEDGPVDGPAVVLASSLGTTWAMWEPQLPALAGRFRVIRYDHRGHGRSPVPPGPYRIDDLGTDLLALLDRLGLDRAHICGISLGGMVAMWLAAHAPDRVDRLALLSTSARLGPPEGWAQRAATVRAEGTAAVADTVVQRWFTPEFAAGHQELVQRHRDMIAATPAAGYAACCAAIEHMNLEPDLSRITAPTLVVVGAEDPAAPPEHAERIAAALPGARLEVLAGTSHLSSVSAADLVNPLLVEFLTAPRD
ncbi:MAG: 3-oxoadipate enol-lactonase [Sporichthyaceae bacterium]|nr:3-oxoadipate enol-lactonase [Sporichthyaceae bacterium]